jgi:hypothetical protein
MQRIALGSDNRVKLIGLTDDTGAIVGTATVTFAITTTAGVSVVGATTMAIVNADTGYYAGTLAYSAALVEGTDYYLLVTAIYSGRRVVWREPCKANYLT